MCFEKTLKYWVTKRTLDIFLVSFELVFYVRIIVCLIYDFSNVRHDTK
jgi:hypothetical protein